MAKRLARKDFLIKDLAISVGGGSRGSAWLPADDGQTPPSPISPIASVMVNLGLIEAVRGAISDRRVRRATGLYRLTGDPQFVARARKLATVAARGVQPGLKGALLSIELELPEQANLPFFHVPMAERA